MPYTLTISSSNGYCTIGGVSITGVLETSFYKLNFEDIDPSIENAKRLPDDTKPVYQTNIFGATINAAGTIIPKDSESRTAPDKTKYNMYSIAISEVDKGTGEELVSKSAENAYLVAAIEFYTKLRLNEDISITGITTIDTKIDLLIAKYKGNVVSFTFTGIYDTLSGTGIIAPNSMSYDYNVFLNTGSITGAILCP